MIDVSFLAQSPGWRWSYSRLRQFETCKYGWLLKYIFEVPQRKLFFSEYGKLMHELIAGHLRCGSLASLCSTPSSAVQTEYARRFHDVLLCQEHCKCFGRTGSIKAGYFMDGLRYLRGGETALAGLQPLAVEPYVEFEVSSHPFCGYIDLVARDTAGAISIVDHKSRALKERGGRRVKSNTLLDEYLRQLYLYSIPVAAQYGPPDHLVFNCFRTGTLITEPFSQAAFEEAIAWALRTIEDILRETDWLPCENTWMCRYLCDVAGECEYAS